ncbi:MAG: hypothetical protein ACRCY9_11785, partial [Phycicoccus sp.]
DPDALDRHDHRSLAAAVLEAWNDASGRATRQLATACPEIFGALADDDPDGSRGSDRPTPADAPRPTSGQPRDAAVQAWERGIA